MSVLNVAGMSRLFSDQAIRESRERIGKIEPQPSPLAGLVDAGSDKGVHLEGRLRHVLGRAA
jgi:hypothetical protein